MAGAHEIRSGMQIIGSDGGMIGVVDDVAGDSIRVREAAGAGRHNVPLAWVARVDDHVHLDRTAALARDTWSGTGTSAQTAPAGEAATDRPARGSKWAWIVGAGLLLMVIYLLVRGFAYAGREPNYEDNAKGELTQDERASSGVSGAEDPSGPAAAGAGALAGSVATYLASSEAAPRTFAFEQLEFDTGSAEVRPQYRKEIADLGAALAARPTSRVRIVGYADARGSTDANADLGARRAAAVAAALVATGLQAGRIETATGGEAGPSATNATAQGQQRNRRTELVVLAR